MQAGNEGVLDCQEAVEGWALKTVQKSSRMSEDVRNYLIERFNDGAKTGNKADPKQVEHEMKHVRNTTGDYYSNLMSGVPQSRLQVFSQISQSLSVQRTLMKETMVLKLRMRSQTSRTKTYNCCSLS